jgi:hypothetical protein
MELGDYYPRIGQNVIFNGSNHVLVIGLIEDGSTYLHKDTWLPVESNNSKCSITVSKIGDYYEAADEIYPFVKADLILLKSKLTRVAIENNIEIVLNFDKTMLDMVPGKSCFGPWLVKEHDFSIRHVNSMDYRYMSDNLAANLYKNARLNLSLTTDARELEKLHKTMDRQISRAFIFSIKIAKVNKRASTSSGGRLIKKQKALDNAIDSPGSDIFM